MKYPYIGKGVNSGSVVVLYSEGFGVTIDSKTWATDSGSVENTLNEIFFKNITREYLDGKYVKVESPEHSEFVQKLAFNAGFKWHLKGKKILNVNFLFLSFHENGVIGRTNKSPTAYLKFEEITIPLPPKEPLNENGFNLHFAGDKCEEWPCIGDEVTWGHRVTSGKVKAVDGDVAWIMNKHGNYVTEYLRDLVKPKSEAEVLRDWLTELWNENEHDFDLFLDIAMNYITKKPQ